MRSTHLITALVKLYRKLPYKPLKGKFANIYHRYLMADKNHRVVVKEVDGIKYELDLSEVIDAGIYYDGAREQDTAGALKRLCGAGYVIFDIGANVGSHTLPLAKAVGETGMVYAFEPVPWALAKLSKNIGLNGFKNIVVEPIALSDCIENNSEFSFRASFKITSGSSVSDDGNLNQNWWDACEKVRVPVETIDNYVLRKNIKRIDLIKLDVDGFEGKVIRGAIDSLNKLSPDIVMEIAPSWAEARGESIENILNSLLALGYKFFYEQSFMEIEDILGLARKITPGQGINIVASKHMKSAAS